MPGTVEASAMTRRSTPSCRSRALRGTAERWRHPLCEQCVVDPTFICGTAERSRTTAQEARCCRSHATRGTAEPAQSDPRYGFCCRSHAIRGTAELPDMLTVAWRSCRSRAKRGTAEPIDSQAFDIALYSLAILPPISALNTKPTRGPHLFPEALRHRVDHRRRPLSRLIAYMLVHLFLAKRPARISNPDYHRILR